MNSIVYKRVVLIEKKSKHFKKWDFLIKEHYNSAVKRNPEYSQKYSREQMRKWWYDKLKKMKEEDVESFIKGHTHANNNGYRYHPV